MTEPTTIQVKAINPKPPKPAAAPSAARPVVHVRSVGATAANVAAAAGEAVFAVGGGVALAAVACAAVGVPIVVAAARGRLQRPASTSSRTVTKTTGRSGGGGPGTGKPRGGGSPGSTGPAGGRLRGLLGGKPGPTGGAPGGATGRRAAAGGAAGGSAGVGGGGRDRRKGGQPGSSKAAGRLRKTIRDARQRRADRPMSPRKAEKLAKKATSGLLVKPGSMPGHSRLRRGSRWLWRKVRGKPATPPVTAPTPAKAGKSPKTPKVGNTVKGSKPAGAATKTPAPAPNPAPVGTRTTKPPKSSTPATQLVAASGGHMTGGPAASAMNALLNVVETDMRGIANRYDPEGIEEVLDELAKWPEVLDALGSLWKIMVTKADEDYPFPATATAVIEEIQRHQHNVARAAEAVPGLIRAIMRERLEAMADKRNAMLDHRANPNTAAM